MRNWLPAIFAVLIPLAATAVATALVLGWLRAGRIVDRPNARSSHLVPTPRGGGIALIGVLLPALIVVELRAGVALWRVALLGAAALLLAVVSWRDDRHAVGAFARLAVQLAAVVAGLAAVGIGAPAAYLGLSTWIMAPALALGWIWFLNLYNFMDGIDGITGVETAAIGVGLVALAVVILGAVDGQGLAGLVLVGCALGFLIWNWQPAKIFMGVVGSVPLGFLVGASLLALANAGHWVPALILPLYYLADATITLLRRAARGEKVWRAHKEHFYQRGVQRGLSHGAVAAAVGVADAILIMLAVAAALGWRWPALAAAAAVVALLLAFFARRPAAR